MAIDFELAYFIKETQLQHGLRSEDHRRYHAYLTNRLATLRQQVKLSNDRKKFLHKEVTAANATEPAHLMLLALYAERCWAEAESIRDTRRQYCVSARLEGGNKPKGGVPPADLAAKRLNKAVKWAEKLSAVAAAVAAPRLQRECAAYDAETRGRCAVAHGRYADAKPHFLRARDAYFALREDGSEEQVVALRLKVSELDDRVVLCMQQLKEDPATYNPPPVIAAGAAGEEGGDGAGTTLRWNGRVLAVSSMKVKDALREARAVPLEAVRAKALEAAGPVAVGQSNKVLDLADRRVNLLNDALAHARQDVRGAAEGSRAKVELQLIVHYCLFHVSLETLHRTLFLAAVYSRRFHATERVVAGGRARAKGSRRGIAPTQFASPLEVVRLYGAAAEAVEQMELLPGVAERDDVAEFAAVVKAGRLVYTGEGWRVVGDTARAEQCYRAAVLVLKDAQTLPEAAALRELAEAASLRMAAENVLSSSSALGAAAAVRGTEGRLPYLSEADETSVQVAENAVPFPPPFQSVACKPTFVDIAATFVDFPTAGGGADAPQGSAAPPPPPSTKRGGGDKAASASAAKGDGESRGEGKKWGWKWGW